MVLPLGKLKPSVEPIENVGIATRAAQSLFWLVTNDKLAEGAMHIFCEVWIKRPVIVTIVLNLQNFKNYLID